MTCGKDAADKGGGNVQNGCGKSFNWDQVCIFAALVVVSAEHGAELL